MQGISPSNQDFTTASYRIWTIVRFVGLVFGVTFVSSILIAQLTADPADEFGPGLAVAVIIIAATIAAILVSSTFVGIIRIRQKIDRVMKVISWCYVGIAVILVSIAFVNKVYSTLAKRHAETVSKTAQSIEACDSIRDYVVYWNSCVTRTLKTASDYQSCVTQAGSMTVAVDELYRNKCDEVYGPIQTTATRSIDECGPIASENDWANCARKFIVDADSYSACVNQSTTEYRKTYCRVIYANVTHDPALCEGIQADSNFAAQCFAYTATLVVDCAGLRSDGLWGECMNRVIIDSAGFSECIARADQDVLRQSLCRVAYTAITHDVILCEKIETRGNIYLLDVYRKSCLQRSGVSSSDPHWQQYKLTP